LHAQSANASKALAPINKIKGNDLLADGSGDDILNGERGNDEIYDDTNISIQEGKGVIYF
jgi:Ca2+-binding RTX toxin-like protein